MSEINSEIIPVDWEKLDEKSPLSGLTTSSVGAIPFPSGGGINVPSINVPNINIPNISIPSAGAVARTLAPGVGAAGMTLPIQVMLDAMGVGAFSENLAARGQELANIRPVDVSG